MELRIRNMFPSYLSECQILCTDENSESSSSSCPCVFPPPVSNNKPSHSHIKTYLIISFSIVATAFFVLCFYAIYTKVIAPRRRTRSLSQPQPEQDFFDEEQQHGPVVDHPIWYIRTVGLQQSIIGAITVCKYKKGEGLIEGTECSVCLSEFQEDESLRLLPKCNHAFHLPCIDTWLRSHTNCPMCRAPIVNDPTRVPSMDPNAFASSNNSFVEMEVLESRVEDTQNSDDNVLRGSGEEQEIQNLRSVGTVQPRRSVSLDSSSANNISLALAAVLGESNSNNNSKRVDGHGNLATKGGSSSSSSSSSSRTRYMQSEPSSMKRSRSFNAKHLLSCYNSRSQRKPNAPLRSF